MTKTKNRQSGSMRENSDFPSDTAIQTHINSLQGIITRMGSNSANCKTWCVTIVSAALILLIDKDKIQYNYIAYGPVMLFCLLDCFYLGLEKEFRDSYKKFVEEVAIRSLQKENMYVISLKRGFCHRAYNSLLALKSFSTTPFYGLLTFMIYATEVISRNICKGGH